MALVTTTGVGLWALQAHHVDPVLQVAAVMPARTTPGAEIAAIKTGAIAPLRAAASKIAASKIAASKIAASKIAPPKIAEISAAALKTPPERVRGLFDPNLTSSYGAVVFARNVALRSGGESQPQQTPAVVSPMEVAAIPPVASASPAMSRVAPSDPAASPVVEEEAQVPLPLPRPASLATKAAPLSVPVGRRVAPQMADVGAVTAPQEKPSFFDKLFGRPPESGPVLAYASPEDGMIGNVLRDTIGRPAAPDRYTAVYNISTHTVTLPDGTRLEAHSGLGAAKDNPRMVTQRMVGATPPNVYDLTPREAPFHGVRALRLTPTGGTTYGRAGLLAHTYMLRGRSGESNGCVVFKDYAAFLRAFESGNVRRLAVVAGV